MPNTALKKKGKVKPASLDTLMKELLKSYDIPTKQDIEKLYDKIDRLEKIIKMSSGKGLIAADRARLLDRTEMTASGTVLKVIKNSRKGADFAKIQAKTGFEDKKLRNIIFRLNKIGKIKRRSRGIYVINS